MGITLLKVAFKALKSHKYKFPKEQINLMQSIFDALRKYKRSENEDDSDVSFAQDVIGKSLFNKNKFFVMNAEYHKTRTRLNKQWAD